MSKLLDTEIGTQRPLDTSLEDILDELNIAHESELPSTHLYKGVLIEFHSMADQIAVEEFIKTLRK